MRFRSSVLIAAPASHVRAASQRGARWLSAIPLCLIGAAALAQGAPRSSDDAYPGRPVRFLIPFAAAGSNDVVARILAHQFPYMWWGIMAPGRTPKATIQKLNRDIREATDTREVRQRFADLGMEVRVSAPEELAKMVASDIKKWAGIIKDAGLNVSGTQ